MENKSPKSSIREISKKLNTDYKNTFNSINALQPDIIIKDKLGNTSLIEIKLSSNQEIYSVENKRTKQFLHENKRLILIKRDIESLNYPFFIVLVFGSIVKKTNTEKSDIDICIISDNKLKTQELKAKLGLLPLNLEIQDFGVNEFESMLEKKQDNLGSEIVKNNVIIYGIENYYNLVSKWMKKG